MALRASVVSRVSQALVAFTIEVDNLLEAAMAAAGWTGVRTSLAMWAGLLRHIPPDGGIAVAELPHRCGLPVRVVRRNLNGCARWGFVDLEGDHVALTGAGRHAARLWSGLPRRVEERWSDRFGANVIDVLGGALNAVAATTAAGLGDHLLAPEVASTPAQPLTGLYADLCRLVNAAAAEHADGGTPRVVSADLLRVLPPDRWTPVRLLPGLTGVARPGIDVLIRMAETLGLVVVRRAPAGRGREIRPTRTGVRAAGEALVIDAALADRWADAPGSGDLTAALEDLLTRRDETGSVLGEGLRPHPGGWRAEPGHRTRTDRMMADPATALPHHPAPLRQGAWPDGA